MSTGDYKEVLDFEFKRRYPHITLQIVESKDQLSIVMNRPADQEVDYDQVAIELIDKINTFELPFEKFKLTGRIEKQAKPEWQQVFENPKTKKSSGFLGGIFKKK